MTSVLDEFEKRRAANQERTLRASLLRAQEKSPDESAKIYDLSAKTGYPVDYIERNRDKVEAERVDYDELQRKSPLLTDFLRQRKNAQIAKDDLENLTWWETAARETKNVAGIVPAAAHTASSAGYSVLGSSFDILSDLTLAPVRAMGVSEEDIAEQDWLGEAGKFFMNIANQEMQAAQSYLPKEGETHIPQPVIGGIQSALINIPPLLAGVVTRNPNVALGAMGGVTYGNSYLEAKNLGLSNFDSFMYAGNNTIAEVVTERMPAIKLLDDIGANAGLFKTVAAQMLIEIPSEQVATVWQDASAWASLNPDKTLSDFMAERKDAAIDTLISTVVATGLQTSVVMGLDRAAKSREQKRLDLLVEKANESKLRNRDPDLFASHLQQVAEEYGSVENVYLDAAAARELYQDLKQDAARQIIDEQIEEAEALGGDIVIPIGDFATKFPTSENYAKLKDHFRLSPESPTQKDLQSDQTQRVADLIKEANENIELKQRADEIYTEVQNQLIATGRLDPRSAKYSAAIIPAYVTTKAARSGLSVDEVYEMMGLKIVGPDGMTAEARGLFQSDGTESKFGPQSSDVFRALSSIFRDSFPVKALDKPIVLESLVDAAARDSKSLSDLIKDDTATSKESSLLSEPALVSMFSEVIRAARVDPQVLDSIVELVPADVVNHLFGSEAAAKMALHDQAMFKDGFTLDTELPVSGLGDTPSSVALLVFEAARTAAKMTGVSRSSGLESGESGETFFAGEGDGRHRAQILFHHAGATIILSKNSDLTSFLHESGHMFLEMEGRLHSHPNATDEIKADGDKILKFLGAKSFDAITTDQHEKWARAMEMYFAEGKAPSVELQSAFRRFAAWLKTIYRSLTRLDVEISDEIRGVMDRMLATDEQIDRMKGRFTPLFESAEDAGATQAEYRAYKEQATPEAAKEALRAKLLKQFQRQHKQWWRDESAVIAKQVRKDLLENPLYAATEALKGNQPVRGFDNLKLSKAIVRGWLGEVGPKFRGMTAEDGMGADELAALFGFASGFEMIDLIQNQPTYAQEVKRLTEKEMVQRHGDALTDGTLEEMAEQAVHNVEHAKKLTQEIAFLARKTKQPAIDREAIKEFAREKIGALPYKKIYPSRYRANEVRSARAAAVAKAQGDNRLALQHKQQELVNFYLAKEAQMQRDKAQKIRSRLKAIQTKKYDSKRYDNDMVNEAKVLIAAFDFRKNNRESVELATARLSSVRNWIESQQQKPENVTTFVEAEILGRVIPYDEMTTEDLQGVNDVVQSILFGAKKAMEADSEAYKREIAETAEYLEKNRIDTYEMEIDTDTPWVRAKSTIQELFASLRKMESLVRQADGMNEQGMLWKKVIKPLLDASNNALAMRTQAHAQLNDIFKGFESAFNGLTDRRQFTLDNGRKVTMSYGARLSLALNMGNDSNMEALLSQGKTTPDSKPYMTERDINRIVATLSEKDWDLVQSIWDYIDTYWPQISELEIKRSGAAPQKVQPREFTTPSGRVMKGGYYPLVGDPIEDSKQLDQDISAQAQQMMQGGAAKKSTKHGSTIERVGFGGKKVDLSINVLFNHIDGIIHDITHWEAVRDVDRVLRHPKIQNELNTSLGKPGARAIKDRLTEVAAGPQRINGMRGWNRVLRHARLAATFGALGYSVRTSITNMIGITSAAMEMDARTVAGGATEYYSNIKSSNEFILSKSKYMRDRGEVLNRDIAFIRNNLKGDTRWNAIKDNAFWMMTQTDKAITRPIWMAAYRQGETMFDTEQAAIDHADRMVARTQGSGLDMDLSNVETRNELMKAMTVMFSAMNAIYNITTEQVKRRKAGKINTVQLATKLTWGIVVAGIAEEMIRGSWGDDEDETVPGKIAASTANMALSLIPVGRDIASYAQYGSSFPTPIVQLGLAPVDVAKQSAQGEIDKAFVRSLTAMSAWALVPGGAQANRTIGYLIDLNEGEIDEFSPWGLIVTGKE